MTAGSDLLYGVKYDWEYKAERDGLPTRIEPLDVLSCRPAGEAGRDGFPQTPDDRFDSESLPHIGP